jgi:hypothetical protein
MWYPFRVQIEQLQFVTADFRESRGGRDILKVIWQHWQELSYSIFGGSVIGIWGNL